MPVEQPVLDTNYKHLKMIRIWPKTTMIKTIITMAIIVAYREENNKMRERERERYKGKKIFPSGESNPGRRGESAKS